MAKYRLLREQLLARRVVRPQDIEEAPAVSDDDVLRVHERGYWERVCSGTLSTFEIRRLGFPWSPALVERSRRSVGATLAAARHALDVGFAGNLAGGTHHAYTDHGEGYCVLNDIAIAARALLDEGLVRRVLVVDLDVHQGNGTAAICRDDSRIFTLSIHGERNYPAHKERSDLDVALPDGCRDPEYLDVLEIALDHAFQSGTPELVLYVAGADVWEGDRLGRLALSRAGIAERDRRVFERCREIGIPLAVVMAGGYAPDPADIAAIHARTIELGARLLLGTGRRGSSPTTTSSPATAPKSRIAGPPAPGSTGTPDGTPA